MKKVYLLIGLTLSMLAVGCNNDSTTDEPIPTPDGDVVVTVNATLPNALEWSEGDLVSINGKEAVANVDALDASEATFVVTDVTSPVILVSPASVVSGLDKVELPAVQNFVLNGYDKAACIHYGIGTFEPKMGDIPGEMVNLDLAPVTGIVSIPIVLDSATAANPVELVKLSVTSLGEAPLSGTWTAALVTEEVTDEATGEKSVQYSYSLTPDTVESTIDIRFEEPVILSTSTPAVINVVVPSGAYAGGFEVIATDAEDHNFIMSSTADLTVEAGATASLPNLTFTVVEKAPATLNVTIAEGHSVVWAENDAVVVNNELSKNVVTAAEVGGKTAQFSFDAVAYPYSVFYPAELYTTTGTVRFYSEQSLSSTGLDRKSLAMAGYSNTTDVTLYSLCGIVTIPITNNYEGENVVIEKVVVKSAMGDAICGKYHINYRTGKLTPVASKSEITLNAVEEDPFIIGVGETVNLQFTVPAGFINNGLILDISSSVGFKEGVSVFPSGVEVRAGAESVADTYIYEEVKIDAIRTANELLEFAKGVNAGRYKRFVNDEGEVILGGDIDMSQLTEPWTPITGLDAAGFDGIFNGKGFAIKNWVTSAPLFDYVAPEAVVQNVVIDQTCDLVVPEDYVTCTGESALGFLIAHNKGSIIGCANNAKASYSIPTGQDKSVHYGTLVGKQIGGLMQNCVNNASFTIQIGKLSKSLYIGGVASRTESSAVIDGCVNNGPITIDFEDKPTGNIYVGGVVSTNNSTEVKNCHNTAKMSINVPEGGALVAMSGITGYSSGAITDCLNEGEITYTSGGAIKASAIAGIAPYSSGVVTNCINRANMSIYCTSFAGANNLGSVKNATCGAAGVLAYAYKADVLNCENHGKITFHMTEANTSTSNTGRQGTAGVVGHPWGEVTNCKNYGDLDVVYKSTTGEIFSTTAQCIMIGGIVCSDYFSDQAISNINNCENHGDIYLLSHLNGSTNTVGGITGWPGKEGARDSGCFGCKNYGNITVEGDSKMRAGGICGGSTNLDNCENHGTITSSGHNTGGIGGLAGFISQGHTVLNSKNFGDVILTNAKSATAAIGVSGLVGNFGNVANSNVKNNIVKCLVKADAGNNVGMLCGTFNGVKSDSKNIAVGTSDEPCQVAGTLNRGGVATQMTAETMTMEYMYGQLEADGADHSQHPLHVIFYNN